MKGKKNKKFIGSRDLRAKLSFDQGWAEKPIYVIKASTNEKSKGVSMIELIKQNFGLSDLEIKERLKILNEEAMTPTVVAKPFSQKVIKLERDSKGNIVSPFKSNRKLY